MIATDDPWWSVLPEPERLGVPARMSIGASAVSVDPDSVAEPHALSRTLELPAHFYHRARKPAVDWPDPFYPYQHDGIDTLLRTDALLLADDMGLGKTVQAVAALRILFRQRRIERALIVAPVSLLVSWRKAVMLWAPELRTSTIEGGDRAWKWRAPVHVYLISYDTLREDFTENPASWPRRNVWDVVVLDEAQRIKNPDVETSRVCKRLPRRRAWALTGTPLENRLEDLASVCEFVTPWEEGQPQLRLGVNAALLDRHAKIQLRRKKALLADQLPEKTSVDLAIELAGEQRRSYDLAEREGIIWLRDLGRDVQVRDVLELILRLKQICNACPRTGRSAKLDDMTERLDAIVAEGNKALVFTQFVDDVHGVKAIGQRLRHLRPHFYLGEMDADQRTCALRAFRDEPGGCVMVLSLRAGGLGLNLQEACYVVHFDRWWNPAVETQAEDRVHRLGQQLPVTVYRYTCERTIEERIDEILVAKRRLFDLVVDDVSLDLGKTLTRAELLGLFGLAGA